MTQCLFCLREIKGPEESWDYGDQSFPCHPSCKQPLRRALEDFRPVDRPDVSGNVWAHCTVTEQDFDYKWERLPEHVKAPRRAEYNALLEKTLDFQEVACKAYASHRGLAEPVVIRESAVRPVKLRGMRRIMERAQPGDHVLIPNIPRTRGNARGEDPSAIMHTMAYAGKMARRGITLHCVYNSIDWNNPFGQQFVRMAAQAQQIHRDTRAYITDYEQTDIYALYGFRWEDMQEHQIFQWVITCIRDKGMSPIEVANASKKYKGVMAYDSATDKTFCVAITRDIQKAKSIRSKGWRRCPWCKRPILALKCPKHGVDTNVLAMRITRRLHFLEYDESFVHTASTLWSWYCLKNPTQDKMPWKSRIGIDEHVS